LPKIVVKLPSDLAMLLKPRRVEDEVRLLVAIELYREGRVSLGKAAEIAGLHVREFLYELHARGISLSYDLEELKEELRVAEDLAGKTRD